MDPIFVSSLFSSSLCFQLRRARIKAPQGTTTSSPLMPSILVIATCSTRCLTEIPPQTARKTEPASNLKKGGSEVPSCAATRSRRVLDPIPSQFILDCPLVRARFLIEYSQDSNTQSVSQVVCLLLCLPYCKWCSSVFLLGVCFFLVRLLLAWWYSLRRRLQGGSPVFLLSPLHWVLWFSLRCI
jgi:hypothetical protein